MVIKHLQFLNILFILLAHTIYPTTKPTNTTDQRIKDLPQNKSKNLSILFKVLDDTANQAKHDADTMENKAHEDESKAIAALEAARKNRENTTKKTILLKKNIDENTTKTKQKIASATTAQLANATKALQPYLAAVDTILKLTHVSKAEKDAKFDNTLRTQHQKELKEITATYKKSLTQMGLKLDQMIQPMLPPRVKSKEQSNEVYKKLIKVIEDTWKHTK